MAKFMQILFVAFLVIALVAAQPKRFQGRRNRLARQELEEPVTPYPSADELKPEVPFDEAVAAEEQTPFTPVSAEGETPLTPVAPEGETPFTPVVNEEETPYTPDEVYGPPEEDEAVVDTQDVVEEEYVPTEEEIASARLTSRRGAVRKAAVRPAKLRKVAARPAKLRKAVPARLQVQPQYVPQPIFYYISQ
ncbi:myb-like protein V [Musca vetustissima]|uniref:myb-like protein V n=1 Tax=Musca vetustissima TaxID=27455 RepID=UPI002AB6C2AE|nr:myb-like protein V [Musca vetustissima]